jgi:hypothetical protein
VAFRSKQRQMPSNFFKSDFGFHMTHERNDATVRSHLTTSRCNFYYQREWDPD